MSDNKIETNQMYNYDWIIQGYKYDWGPNLTLTRIFSADTTEKLTSAIPRSSQRRTKSRRTR